MEICYTKSRRGQSSNSHFVVMISICKYEHAIHTHLSHASSADTWPHSTGQTCFRNKAINYVALWPPFLNSIGGHESLKMIDLRLKKRCFGTQDLRTSDRLQSPEMGNLGNTIFGTQKWTFGGALLGAI